MDARRLVTTLAVVFALTLAVARPGLAQETHWPDAQWLETQIFFGQAKAGGGTVSDDDWKSFLDEVVSPRFPDGLTVLTGIGQSLDTQSGKPRSGATMMLLVVHENSNDAQTRFGEIIAEYKKRFGDVGVFHVDFPARIAK